MTEPARKYLLDITRALGLIRDFTASTVSFESYSTDLKTQSAVERQLEIVGEALKNLRHLASEVQIHHAKQSIELHNNLLKDYSSNNNRNVWAYVQNRVAPLHREVLLLLEH